MALTLADILASPTALSLEQAAALAAAAMELAKAPAGAPAAGLPPPGDIVVGRGGRVSFTGAAPESSERDRVGQAGVLLQRLLRLDGPPGDASPNVPGPLLVLIARATGQIDLPPPSYAALHDALGRFGAADAAGTLAAIHTQFAPRRTAALSIPRLAAALRARPRHALAASLAAVTIALAWGAWPGVRDGDTTVPVVHERRVVKVPPPEAPRREPPSREAPPREADRPVAAPTPLLSADAVGADTFSPTFGRDGRDLLFHAGRARSSLMRASFDRGGRAAITTVLQDGAANYHVTLSPDGRWLAFDSDRDGTRGVYVAPSDFSDALEPRRISGGGYAAMPRWAPDGRTIAFVKAERARPRVWNVWIADLAGGRLSRVSRHAVGQTWAPSWFPAGDRLAYSVEDTLVIAHLGRGTAHVVRSPRPGRLVRTPAVSPDGRWIVFQVHRDGAWLLDVSTGRMRRVLDDGTAEEFAWSPDGRRVIYHTKRQGAWSLWQLVLPPAA